MIGVSFSREKIGMLLEDFHLLTGIRIAFYSWKIKESIASPDRIMEFCRILRKDQNADQKCRECDRRAFEQVGQMKDFYLYECHAGLSEGVAPILYNENVLGYLMMGQVLRNKPDEEIWIRVYDQCKDFKVDFIELKEAFFKLPHISWDRLYAAVRVMDMGSKFIFLSQSVKIHETALIEKIKTYALENLDKSVSIKNLSRQLNMNDSYLSHIIKAEFKMSFTKYIHHLKMEKAMNLLEETDIDIKEISQQLGFSDSNYFARLFKRYSETSASDYRINNRKKQKHAN